MPDESMYELIELILRGVTFIAVGGAVALLFFFVSAPHILGVRAVQRQLRELSKQTEELCEQLKQIAEHLRSGRNDPDKKD